MAEVDISDLIQRTLRRLIWLDQKCEIYDNEIPVQLKIVDQFNKTLVSLLKLLQFEMVVGDSDDELSRLLSQVAEDVQG